MTASRVKCRIGVVAVMLMALTACSQGNEAASPPTPRPLPTSLPTTVAPTPEVTVEPSWPLTGLPATAEIDRPALTVKIDNTSRARPQLGLSSADLIVEELVEGGLTRLAVVFQSAVPDVAGPVRSVRDSDVGIVLPAGGVVAASGGAGRVLRALDKAGVRVLTEGTDGFSRASGRRAPYNVVLDPAVAMAGLTSEDAPTGPYLPWGTPAPGGPATEVDVTFSPAHTTSWSWDGAAWRRSGELAADGDEFAPVTVLVLAVAVQDAGYRDPAGNPVPETVFTGSGQAWLLTGGTVVEGRWTKADAAAPVSLTGSDGTPLAVPPGRTWIELMPEAGNVDVR